MVNGGSPTENLEHAPRMKRNGPKKSHARSSIQAAQSCAYGPIWWMTTPQFRSSISTTCSNYERMGTSCLDCIRKRRLRTSSMTKTEMVACSKSFIFGIALGTPMQQDGEETQSGYRNGLDCGGAIGSGSNDQRVCLRIKYNLVCKDCHATTE